MNGIITVITDPNTYYITLCKAGARSGGIHNIISNVCDGQTNAINLRNVPTEVAVSAINLGLPTAPHANIFSYFETILQWKTPFE